ncbi:unnamed protein product [Linum trigynum]|uniref:KIB1-4 beta-propeller domain-containing protein n=1 Tax=Linum trigynum TaxID=586398 RepID=A0AAV2GEZ3_9ROSI
MVISAEEPNWSGLPGELLDRIGHRLAKLKDFIRFKAVCKSWRRALFLSRFRQSIPWLMLPHCRDSISQSARVGCKGTDSCRCFYDLEEQTFRHIELPQSIDKTCCGSAFGWVFMKEKLPSVMLLNPLSKDQISLPPITAFSDVLGFRPELVGREYLYVKQDGLRVAKGKKQVQRRFIIRVSFSGEPASEECIVMVIRGFDDCTTLAFCSPNRDDKWTIIPHGGNNPDLPNEILFEDMVFWRGRFYVFVYTGTVYVCDLSHQHCPKLSLFLDESSPQTRKIFRGATSFYLLTSPVDDELMVITRHLRYPNDDLVAVNTHHVRYQENEDDDGVANDDEWSDDSDYADDDGQTTDDDDHDDELPVFVPYKDDGHGKVDRYIIDSESDDDDVIAADKTPLLTDKFRVFKARECRTGWDEVDSIGDFALFLGYNKPTWVSTRDHPELSPNSIYFTDDATGSHYPRKFAGADMGVYDLTTHTISPFYRTASVHKNPSLIFPLPVWISPSNY